jgi:flagellin-like hook-associated protein FlgL
VTGSIGSTQALVAFQALEKNRDRFLTQFKNSSTVTKEIDYFKAQLKKINTVEEFTKDPRLVKFAATAFGLEADIQYPARLRKVLTESVADDNALSNRLSDPRYKEMAKFFGFGETGLTKAKLSFTQDELFSKYTTAAFEKAQGERNPALREALYFERKIGSIKSTYDIMGDTVLRSMVTYTLDLPPQIAVQSVEKQKALIDAKLNIEKFKNTAASTATNKITDAENDTKKLTPLSKALDAAQAKATEIVDQLEALRVSYDRLANETSPSGPYATEIPFQQAAVPGLGRQQGLLSSASQATGKLAEVQAKLGGYITEALDSGTTLARQAELKTLFQAAVTEAGQYASEATYGSENLLDGSIAGPISTTIKSDGQAISTRSHNLNNGVLDTLAAANAAFQADNFAGAQASQQASSTALSDVSFQLSQDAQIFNTGIASVAKFVPALDTANIREGQQTVATAQAAAGTASGIVGQIRALADQATNAGLTAPERTALNDQYLVLRDQLRDAIDAGSYSGNSLLDGSTVSIGVGAGANEVVIDGNGNTYAIGGTNLKRFADDTAPPPESLYNLDLTSAVSAQSVVDSVDTQINPEIQKAYRTLGTSRSVFDLAETKLDPRGALDAKYRKLASDLDGLIKGAGFEKTNLLESNALDQTVRSAITGAAITVHGQSNFRAFVETTLKGGADTLLTDFAGARRALDDAAFFARRFQSNLKTDSNVVKNQQTYIAQAKADAEKAQSTTQDNAFVDKFIQRYLLKKDLEAAKSGGYGGGNSYVLSLLS